MGRKLQDTFDYSENSASRSLPAYEDETECSETSEYKIQTSGNTQMKADNKYGLLLLNLFAVY